MSSDDKPKKEKFSFECTKCGVCCENRGPIPITFTDLQLWAKNNVVSNFLPYLKMYKNPMGFFDLILSPLKFKTDNEKSVMEEDKSSEEDKSEEVRCPLFNSEKRQCLVYEYRPLSCRTYPLEFTGEKYQVVDTECPGIGKGSMTKEERVKMRDNAQKMYSELIKMRVSMPVLYQTIQKDLYLEMIKQQQEAMKNMNPEDLQRINEILNKEKKENNGK